MSELVTPQKKYIYNDHSKKQYRKKKKILCLAETSKCVL